VPGDGDGGGSVAALGLELIYRLIPERFSALVVASLLKGFYPIFGEWTKPPTRVHLASRPCCENSLKKA
jgi:hypothetical protein